MLLNSKNIYLDMCGSYEQQLQEKGFIPKGEYIHFEPNRCHPLDADNFDL